MTSKPGPLPTYSEAVYKHPNPDGSRKSCANCIMFAKDENRCVIHPSDLVVRSHYYCDYHVFGAPATQGTAHPGMRAVDPAFSGLRLAGGGLSCDLCIYYSPHDNDQGHCTALTPEEGSTRHAPVAALASCARLRSP